MVTQNMLRTPVGKYALRQKIQFVTSLDLIKCLKLIKQQRLLFAYETYF